MQSRLAATRNRGYWVFSSLTRNRVSQQRSHVGASTSALEDVSCVGLDGTPLLEEGDRGEEGEEEEERAYYKEHKPSPLSMIEVVDTRKPITRATDGTAREYESGEYVVVWIEE
ncbi:hypothetical protein HHK36_022975 [Tetracentron sinense]|uniref:Uncharacterized protein n=1 Tax=Tetracentron sinense TaxID=13715 RepID=A0A835D9D0_TETSI|nr:hypothetical protein HHK36_022975 [Tetracentron sinense]